MKKYLSVLLLFMLLGTLVFAQDVVLVLWDIRTESDNSTPAVLDAIARFEADHPGVKIKHEPISNDHYKTRIRTAMSANNEPDIFMTWGSSSLELYVENDKVLNLTPYMNDKWLNRFIPSSLNIGIFDGDYYGLPVTSMNAALVFYRTDMFEKYGLEVPETYEELLDVIETLKENGIIPFTL